MTKAKSWKDWEKDLIALDEAISKLKSLQNSASESRKDELNEKIQEFERRRDKIIETTYSNLGPWEKVLVARAEPRPYTLDYIHTIFTDFTELQGDRRYGADQAIVGGPAALDGQPVMVVGHQKGRNISERQARNFAMAKPEGYRKAIRLFEMADRFKLPIVTFIDTPAADPGVESESRGISEAIAAGMLAMFGVSVPVVSVVIGEGGSGGAIGIGVANHVAMLEHSVYSVIPPEGCAAILWRAPEMGPEAAAALRLTATSAKEYGLVDEIIQEPFGGAHRDPLLAADRVGMSIRDALKRLHKVKDLRSHRYEKFRKMGILNEAPIITGSR